MHIDDHDPALPDLPPTRPRNALTSTDPVLPEATRRCTSCGHDKPAHEFSSKPNKCLPCNAEYHRRWRAANRDKLRGYWRDHNARRKADAEEAAEVRLEAARQHIRRGAMPLDYADFIALEERVRESRDRA